MNARVIVGVIGPGEASSPENNELAYALGEAIAREGWITLTGGRAFGVMDAALKGAAEAGGLTIGILPGENDTLSSVHAQIRIITGMGSARNNQVVLSSHVLVVCGMAAGTASEVALAIKADKRLVFLGQEELCTQFFRQLGHHRIKTVQTVGEAIDCIRAYVNLGQLH